ncbi:hypothetical protein GCM10010384_19250 [Streptomyces djakartensis]|uniref:Uncharacterized protein n=1 Tax=Streptomyces djakartensis TaxID=68193 RepID=A0ABQ2ZHV9_9ACTN|nr:hypothetical protein GCM10010384_19250 [Streptomyces djakartensis]
MRGRDGTGGAGRVKGTAGRRYGGAGNCANNPHTHPQGPDSGTDPAAPVPRPCGVARALLPRRQRPGHPWAVVSRRRLGGTQLSVTRSLPAAITTVNYCCLKQQLILPCLLAAARRTR